MGIHRMISILAAFLQHSSSLLLLRRYLLPLHIWTFGCFEPAKSNLLVPASLIYVFGSGCLAVRKFLLVDCWVNNTFSFRGPCQNLKYHSLIWGLGIRGRTEEFQAVPRIACPTLSGKDLRTWCSSTG